MGLFIRISAKTSVSGINVVAVEVRETLILRK